MVFRKVWGGRTVCQLHIGKAAFCHISMFNKSLNLIYPVQPSFWFFVSMLYLDNFV